ncbi:hypothetical protein JTB14_001247 [Gonioctena quinquepunctata]|nr:hypothetical protein JTB14_001247 [Gonioctena quinquepunctata]
MKKEETNKSTSPVFSESLRKTTTVTSENADIVERLLNHSALVNNKRNTVKQEYLPPQNVVLHNYPTFQIGINQMEMPSYHNPYVQQSQNQNILDNNQNFPMMNVCQIGINQMEMPNDYNSVKH